MKHFFAFCFCLNSFLSIGQVVDSFMSLQVNRLIDSSRQLTAEQHLAQAMQVGEAAQKTAYETFGKESAEYARCQFNLGRILQAQGSYDSAEPLYLEAKAIREKVLGKENGEYVWSLNNLAKVYREMGRYESAEPLYLEALDIQEKVFGKEGPMYARLLDNLALLYHTIGRYEAAEPLFLQAKGLRKKLFGIDHSDYAISLNNLADLYTDMGRNEDAELFYLEAKTIRGKLGKENNEYAQTLNSLAILYHNMGRYESAGQHYGEAKAIWEKMLGKGNSYYAIGLNNLAGLYYDMGDYKSAEPLYHEANVFWKKKFGEEHQNYAAGLSNLAEVYIEMGRYEAAASLHLEAKAIRAKVLGKMHPSYAVSLSNMALLYHRMGRYKDAEPLYLEAKAVQEKVLGKIHPEFAASLNKLANLYADMHRYKDAELLYREANSITNALLSNSSRYLSDRELSAYVQLFTKDLDHYYSFAQMNRGELFDFAASSYDNTLFHKGFLLNVSSRIHKLAASDTTATRLNNLLKSYHRRLAREYAKPIAERAGMDELLAQANLTEKELVRTVTGFSEAIQQVSWQEVQSALAPGEAAVEFIHYRYYNPFRTDSVLYAALVLKPGEKYPFLVPLFEERQLARLLPKCNDMDRIDEFYKTSIGKSVYELIWQPLENLLEGINKVYCSPSGLLHCLNLGAIAAPSPFGGLRGETFANRHRLVLLGSTRQLVSQHAGALPTSTQAVLFGGIQYDSCDTKEEPYLRIHNRSLEQVPDTVFAVGGPKTLKFLHATLSEVQKIAQMLGKEGFSTQLNIGTTATEESFKQLGHAVLSPRILHLATHGYFFPDPKTSPNRQTPGETSLLFKTSDHPMIRSGLALAGANEVWITNLAPTGREDGILTAYEISQVDLSNTELVVLSACETGLGQIEGNEGVFGLQRAFKIAGAKYLIMSLWQVNDQKTGELMIEFYRQYLERHLSVPEAFWQAQQTMRAKYPDSPYLWAAFVLVE